MLGVAEEGGPVWREGGGRDAEEGGHAFGFGVVGFALGGGEGREDEVVGVDGGEDEGGVDPEEGGYVVGGIGLAGGMGADGGGKLALDGGVAAMELAGGGEGLGSGAEEHGVDDAEGGVEAADGIVEKVGVVGEGGGDPGMGELEEGGSAGAEEDGGFAVDLPGDGAGAEEAEARVAGEVRQMREEVFDVGGGDVLLGRKRRHGWMLDAGAWLILGMVVTVCGAAHRMQRVRRGGGCDRGWMSALLSTD